MTKPLMIVENGKPSSGLSVAVSTMKVEYSKEINIRKYKEFIRAAKKRKVDLIVFPEMSLQGYLWSNEPSWCLPSETSRYHWNSAETVPGKSTDILCKLAKQNQIYIAFGMGRRGFFDNSGIEMLYNSAVIVGPDGIIGVQDKIHNPGGEKHIFRSGKGIEVFETPLGKIGMLICWDIAFPEVPRIMALKGADILILCTAWGIGSDLIYQNDVFKGIGHHAYELFVRCRALENNVWMLSSNWVGKDTRSGFDFRGGSTIIHPMGVDLVKISDSEGLAIAHGLDIKGERLKCKTDYLFGNNIFLDRRPDLYGPLSHIF